MANNGYIIGSVSSGTMKAEDLIPTFLSAAEELELEDSRLKEIEERMNKDEDEDENSYFDSEDAGYDLEKLFDILNEAAPPYFYFGANEGADYGFWLCEGAFDDFSGLKVDDTSKVPGNYTGEVLHVNDHGNATLYTAQDGKLTEIWAIV